MRFENMANILQVGAGSGGLPVLDLLGRDQAVTNITLIEPDVYKSHNVGRHWFPHSAVGMGKAELAKNWLRDRRPELDIDLLSIDLLDPNHAAAIDQAARTADLGICAADNEPAKYHFDALMRRHGKPWTLGEVLSGGIGGFVHWFAPGGPCYGCVATFLKRTVTVDQAKAPDYSQPGGPAPEVTIPASKTAINVIAALHAQLTSQLLDQRNQFHPGFTSLLFTLEAVPGIFAEPYRPYKFKIARDPACLCCGQEEKPPPANLDQALADALGRLG